MTLLDVDRSGARREASGTLRPMELFIYKARAVAGGFENAGAADDVEELLTWIRDAPMREGLLELRDGKRITHFRVASTAVAKNYDDQA